jgi:GT2 family glycosyltransferase
MAPKTKTESGLRSSLELINGCVFTGFVADPTQPTRRFTVELLIDGLVVKTAYADNYVQDFAGLGIGDGCYGFAISIPPAVIEDAQLAEVRIANLGVAVGLPLALGDLRHQVQSQTATSQLRWLGGLRFSGWVSEASNMIPTLLAMVDGEQIMQVTASGWAQADDSINKDRPARAFSFHLPERFADGCVRWLTLSKAHGEALSAGAVPFVAFRDGLLAAIDGFGNLDSERLRGELYDHLIPASLSMSQYDQWRQRFPFPSGSASSLACAVVMVGTGSTQATLDSLEDQSHARWTACAMDDQGGPTAFEAGAVQAFLADEAADSDFVVFVLTGTVLAPDALQRIAQAFSDFEGTAAVYGDVDILTAEGGIWPLAFSAFDYERLLEQGYCAHLFALRREVADGLVGSRLVTLYRLFDALFDRGLANATRVIHIPGALGTLPSFDRAAASAELRQATASHLKQRRMTAKTTLASAAILPAVRVQRELPAGRTTIIIPIRDRVALLRSCLETIAPAVEKLDAEIMIVDNDSTDPATLDFLAEITGGATKVIRVEGPFNFARLNNIAASATRSEFLCLLNNDIKARDADWLEEMLTRMAEPDVGAVGALLMWPSGVVQHGGVVLGANFAATHAFNDRTANDPGYCDLLRVAHECSAVTAACMLTRRSDYLAVGGMDEMRLSVAFNDTDYCLKLRQAGKRIVFTPHASLVHFESASRGHDNQRDRAARFQRELATLRGRWGQVLIDDPYYNPMLSLDAIPFSALAWPPRNMAARLQRRIAAREIPPGF